MNTKALRLAMTDLSGKTAIVTGGARGQGADEVRLLAECGARVLICDVLEDEGITLAKELTATGYAAQFHKLDVTSAENWQTICSEADHWTGRLDILVNNAGIINRTLIEQTERANWDRVLNVNLTGPFLGIQTCAPLMKRSGGGSIINISSNSAFSGHYDPAYTASKWGLRGLTRSAAMEFAGDNIRVNTVCPGLVITGLNADSPHLRPMIEMTPQHRSGKPEDIAQLVLYLASDASTFVTGSDFVIDGGFTAGAAYRQVAVKTGIIHG